MDGILIDLMGSYLQVWQKVCEVYGYLFDYDYMYSLGGILIVKIIEMFNEKFGLDYDFLVVVKDKYQFWVDLQYYLQVIDEIVVVFEKYYGVLFMGVGIGVDCEYVIVYLIDINLINKIGVLVIVSDVSKGKLNFEIFLKVVEFLGVELSKCVVFEDM